MVSPWFQQAQLIFLLLYSINIFHILKSYHNFSCLNNLLRYTVLCCTSENLRYSQFSFFSYVNILDSNFDDGENSIIKHLIPFKIFLRSWNQVCDINTRIKCIAFKYWLGLRATFIISAIEGQNIAWHEAIYLSQGS